METETVTTILLSITALALLIGLLYAEKKETTRLVLAFKTPLSCLFVLTALWVPHPVEPYFQTILLGLIFGLVGDICLAIPSQRAFMVGLVAFLLGHILYVVAFVSLSPLSNWLSPAIVPILLFSGGTFLWLRPHLNTMLVPVTIYIVVITVMMCGAIAVFKASSMPPQGAWTVLLGGVLFGLSDFFVARQRFMKQQYINKWLGLPLYYAGQFLLAFSVGFIDS